MQEEEVVEEGEEEVVECVQVGDEEGGRGGFLPAVWCQRGEATGRGSDMWGYTTGRGVEVLCGGTPR